MPLRFLAVAVGSLAAAVWLIGRLLPWLRSTLLPSAHGSSSASPHSARSVPCGGGFAIVTVVLLAGLAIGFADPAWAGRLACGLVPAALVAVVSLRDDFRPLPAILRLAVHVAAAAIAIVLLGPVDAVDLGTLGSFTLEAAAGPLTLLWVVGMTNAFNFMDGVDGVAGITATAAGAALAVAAAVLGELPLAFLSTAFAAASLGFLAWNWPPARVFMGDVGSTFCGFVIAILPLLPSGEERSELLLTAVMASWPFIFDSGFTLLRRLFNRENILQTHSTHLYQRLVASGWSHRAVAMLYGGLAAMSSTMVVCPLFDPGLRETAASLAPATVLVGSALLLTLAELPPRFSKASGREHGGIRA